MAKYIDADKLFAYVDGQAHLSKGRIMNFIRENEVSGANEVVRCGQCEHWRINPNNLYGGYCRYCETAHVDHYCSYGKRKPQKEGDVE